MWLGRVGRARRNAKPRQCTAMVIGVDAVQMRVPSNLLSLGGPTRVARAGERNLIAGVIITLIVIAIRHEECLMIFVEQKTYLF